MKYGICSLSIIPQRAEPKDQAEMVNQILFGDLFSIIETKNQWRKVSLLSDGYTGWIDEKQLIELNVTEFEKFKKSKQLILEDNIGRATLVNSNKEIQVYKGTTFYFSKNNHPLFAKTSNNTIEATQSSTALLKYAFSLLSAPYLWGGRSISGIDCSGFTQIVLKLCGHTLYRDTPEQEKQGELVLFENSKPSDLVFFSNKKGKVMHVGILLENHKIIHASGEIRIDNFTNKGIYNTEKKLYTHQLHSIKRLL